VRRLLVDVALEDRVLLALLVRLLAARLGARVPRHLLDAKERVAEVVAQLLLVRQQRRRGVVEVGRRAAVGQLEPLREHIRDERGPALLRVLLHKAAPALGLLGEHREVLPKDRHELERAHLLRRVGPLELADQLTHRKQQRLLRLAAGAGVLLQRERYLGDADHHLQRRVEVASVAEVRQPARVLGRGERGDVDRGHVLHEDRLLGGRLGHRLGRTHEHQHLALLDAQRLPVRAVLDGASLDAHDLLPLDRHVGERE